MVMLVIVSCYCVHFATDVFVLCYAAEFTASRRRAPRRQDVVTAA